MEAQIEQICDHVRKGENIKAVRGILNTFGLPLKAAHNLLASHDGDVEGLRKSLKELSSRES